MFEQSKAKKLGIKDLGSVSSYYDKEAKASLYPIHKVCNRKVRAGKRIKEGCFVRWCSKCEVVIQEFSEEEKSD